MWWNKQKLNMTYTCLLLISQHSNKYQSIKNQLGRGVEKKGGRCGGGAGREWRYLV